MRGGTYHQFANLGNKQITLQSYPNEAVWLDGSQPVTGWVPTGSAWRKDGWTFAPDTTDPTASNPDPFFRMVDPNYPMANFPDELFYDGAHLTQVGSLGAVGPGTFFVDRPGQKLYMGDSPIGHQVEAATLEEAIYTNGNGTVIRGIGVRRYATPIVRYGTVKLFADNVSLENVLVLDSATTGVGVQGAYITLKNITVSGNGLIGVSGDQSDHFTTTTSLLTGNNVEHFKTAPMSGGLKLTSSRYATISANDVSNNQGMGIWFDASSYMVNIVGNIAQSNSANAIQFEVSGYGVIADNLVADNGGDGIRLADANNVRVWNNTLSRNARAIYAIDGPRVATNGGPGRDPRYSERSERDLGAAQHPGTKQPDVQRDRKGGVRGRRREQVDSRVADGVSRPQRVLPAELVGSRVGRDLVQLRQQSVDARVQHRRRLPHEHRAGVARHRGRQRGLESVLRERGGRQLPARERESRDQGRHGASY